MTIGNSGDSCPCGGRFVSGPFWITAHGRSGFEDEPPCTNVRIEHCPACGALRLPKILRSQTEWCLERVEPT